MNERRGFLKAGLLGVGAGAGVGVGAAASALPAAAADNASATEPAASPSAGWQFLRPAEAAFAESLADHMVPADALTPCGSDIGIAVYIDRALAGAWGQGERLYRQGPFQPGSANQGYQLPLTPAELFRSGTEALQQHCRAAHGGRFEQLSAATKDAVLLALQAGTLELAVPAATYFAQLHQLVIEGLFADPVHGGNRDKAGWKLVGFPGVVQTHRRHIVEFHDRRFETAPLSIADLA